MINFKKLLCGLTLISSLFVVGCTSGTSASQETFVTLKINPEVGLVLGKDRLVKEVVELNEDAEIVLSDVDLTGKTIEDAAEEFSDAANAAGYIKDTNDITVTVDVQGDEESSKDIKEKVEKRVEKFFRNHGFFGKISEATLDEYLEQAKALNVSCGKMKLILKVLDLMPEKTLEEVKDLTTKELVELIHSALKEQNLGSKLNKEFKAEMDTLKEKYKEMFTLKETIKTLEAKLEDETLTEEEKTQITTELETARTSYKTMFDAFKLEVDALKAKYKALKPNRVNECKKDKEEKCNNHKGK